MREDLDSCAVAADVLPAKSAAKDGETMEQRMVRVQRYQSITRNLRVGDINSISEYGSELGAIMSQNSEELLNAVRTNSSGEVGELTSQLLGQLELVDFGELASDGLWKRFMRRVPGLKHLVPTVQQILNKYDTISETVTKISDKIQAVGVKCKRNNNALQRIFENDVEYIRQIRELIDAAQLRLEEAQNQLFDMQERPSDFEEYELSDAAAFVDALRKKISDMGQVEYAMKMNLIQIRGCQQNNNLVANKAQAFVTNVVPVWKSQLSISVMLEDTKRNSEALKLTTDTTNDILRKNAELLKMSSIAIAKENSRGVFDIETLRKATDSLIEGVNEVARINNDACDDYKRRTQAIMELENRICDAMSNAVRKTAEGSKRYVDVEEARVIKEVGDALLSAGVRV